MRFCRYEIVEQRLIRHTHKKRSYYMLNETSQRDSLPYPLLFIFRRHNLAQSIIRIEEQKKIHKILQF